MYLTTKMGLKAIQMLLSIVLLEEFDEASFLIMSILVLINLCKRFVTLTLLHYCVTPCLLLGMKLA